MNTKFCISTGHWITYECLLDTGTVVHLQKPANQVWMLNHDKQWVSGYGGNRTHDEMFVSILRHLDHVFLLHKAY